MKKAIKIIDIIREVLNLYFIIATGPFLLLLALFISIILYKEFEWDNPGMAIWIHLVAVYWTGFLIVRLTKMMPKVNYISRLIFVTSLLIGIFILEVIAHGWGVAATIFVPCSIVGLSLALWLKKKGWLNEKT